MNENKDKNQEEEQKYAYTNMTQKLALKATIEIKNAISKKLVEEIQSQIVNVDSENKCIKIKSF